MKNEGVTILQIVLTVIIMILLTTLAILYGQGVPTETKIVRTYTEIREIKNAITEAQISNKIKVNDNNIVFYEETEAPKVNATEYTTVLGGNTTGTYYYLDFTSTRKLENTLELENVKNDYLLDLNNREIYLIKGIELNISGETKKEYKAEKIEKYYNNVFK